MIFRFNSVFKNCTYFHPSLSLRVYSRRPSSRINYQSISRHSKSGTNPLNFHISFWLFYSCFLYSVTSLFQVAIIFVFLNLLLSAYLSFLTVRYKLISPRFFTFARLVQGLLKVSCYFTQCHIMLGLFAFLYLGRSGTRPSCSNILFQAFSVALKVSCYLSFLRSSIPRAIW